MTKKEFENRLTNLVKDYIFSEYPAWRRWKCINQMVELDMPILYDCVDETVSSIMLLDRALLEDMEGEAE